MKLQLDGVSLAIEIDPEDLSDADLTACLAEANARGLLPRRAADLHLAIERAFAALLAENLPMATAELGRVLPAETVSRHVKRVALEKKPRAA